MSIDGEVESLERKVNQDTGAIYVKLRMKGRTFLGFDPELVRQIPRELNGRYVRLSYSFFKWKTEPNVYRLESVTVQ